MEKYSWGQLTTLPLGWHPHNNLNYPINLKMIDGTVLKFENYNQHHAFIQKLFLKK